MAKGADGESATSPPRPRAGKCSTPMIERRPPGWLRPTAAEPTSERAVLAARRSRFEATAAGLASATVLARSTVRIALAKPDDVGLIRRRTGWRGGPVPARPTARPWPPSRATPNRPTGEPATPLPRGCGPAGSTALCSTYAPNLTPRLDSTNSVLRRGPGPGSEISPDGARHRAEVQSTQLKRRQPALTRLVGARCRVHACCLDWPVTSGVEERVRPAASWLTIQAVGRWLDWLSLCRSSPVGDVPA
jgi:hypothetical protein